MLIGVELSLVWFVERRRAEQSTAIGNKSRARLQIGCGENVDVPDLPRQWIRGTKCPLKGMESQKEKARKRREKRFTRPAGI